MLFLLYLAFEILQPNFSGSFKGLASYLAYLISLPIERSFELSFKIVPSTMYQISLLAFIGQSGVHDEKSNHLSVSFVQGKCKQLNTLLICC